MSELIVKTTYERNFAKRRLHRAECRHAQGPVGRVPYDPDKHGRLHLTPCRICKPEMPS